ncbi:hypothetical protein M2459_002590 [Parabacteroides sp. PF5-5]|uniref:hypothetical protein n=1 Tax=unclassified Parabacteroides TaxID=2649774 RepID=UPI0024758A0C|nr:MULTISPECIES: hypothetical protein [unclassified Parabacteroides]MDH6305654.1 hypothetical protein [Parabacteroides sp. PH5-39]MDH6316726.1 hypothetical protein [Parabacteroides sp. PF5-13]MDH6320367.1 hypothetical protein [Parabacteroides sp. PH5-13]MDH6324097.1 hypothetical protein [Parabacteroides sp. PH5-8]MDH6327912.1 hypothetical protein [Parabacteroides sp. PH5-41]
MKKTFKFFMMAAIVAAGFTACSSEEVTPDPKNPIDNTEEVEGKETYATFALSSLDSRAYTMQQSPAVDTDDSKIDPSNVVLLIYKSTGVLEKKVFMNDTKATVLLTAGKKKIYAIANYKGMTTAPNDIVSVIGTDDNTGYKVGESMMSDLMSLTFDANQANQASFGFAKLHERSGSFGLPASNDNSLEYNLVADVASDTAAGGTPSNTNESTTNTFNIQLYFMLAKANLYLGNSVLHAGDVDNPGISNIQYTIRNMARYTNIIRKGSGQAVQSYYYNRVWSSGTPQQSDFDSDIDYSTAIDKTAATTVPTQYFYLPENNHNYLLEGQSSFFAIKAVFKPNNVIKDVTYNVASASLKTEVDQLANIGQTSWGENALDYIYTIKELKLTYGTIQAGTYFKHIKLLQKAAWILENMKEWNDTYWTEAEAIAGVTASDMNKSYYQFADATSYYRLDIGDDATGNSLEPGVLRGNKYQVMISKISGPGKPLESNLKDTPWVPVVANTHLHAVIIPAEWTTVIQQGNLE